MKSFHSLLVLLFAAIVHAASATGDRLLVLLDYAVEKEDYSTFLGDLEARGFNIEYGTPKSDVQLFHLGERAYDHVLLFPSKSKGLGPNLSPSNLVKFINANGNILVTTDGTTNIPTSVVGFLGELDISLPFDRTGLVVDHFNYDTISAAEKHDVLVLPAPVAVRSGVKDLFHPDTEEVLAFPSGTGHVLGSSALINPVLRAPKTAYSYNPKEQFDAVDPDELFATGEQLSLVSTFQGRNSARVGVVGSAAMLTNKWFDAKVQKVAGDAKVGTWNREFAKRISGWAFQEIGVLKVNSIEHRLTGDGVEEEVNPKIYRVGTNMTYSISVSEHAWDSWVPYVLPGEDALQLEITMLDPYHRVNLLPIDTTADATTYSLTVTLPEKHGIFNYVVNYKRPFLTNLEEKRTVTLRHVAHDEWPRSYAISSSWPWLTGLFATCAGFVAFCALWMYSAPEKQTTTKKTQ